MFLRPIYLTCPKKEIGNCGEKYKTENEFQLTLGSEAHVHSCALTHIPKMN